MVEYGSLLLMYRVLEWWSQHHEFVVRLDGFKSFDIPYIFSLFLHQPVSEKEQELEDVLRDLANCKVQLEVKDAATMQALLKLDHYRKTTDELSVLLMNSEVERDTCINECIELRTKIDEFESRIEGMTDQLLENAKAREQLLNVLSELNTAREELLHVETDLADARESEFKAMMRAEQMETAANMERGRMDELLKEVSDLNEAVLHSKLAAIEAEKKNSLLLSEKEVELQFMITSLAQAQEQLEELRKQTDRVQFLESELLKKSVFIETLQFELKEAHQLHSLSDKAASDAINNLSKLKSDFEKQILENSEKAVYINSLEMELNQLKIELNSANEEVGRLNCDVEMLPGELERTKIEVDEIRSRENEAQVEIALLKSELHKGRSKVAAAEAAEARAESVKSGLYLAVQQLAVEAEEAKKESQRLKQRADEAKEMTGGTVFVNSQFDYSSKDLELSQTDESKKEAKARKGDQITISLMEYESLISKAEKVDQIPAPPSEKSRQSVTSEDRYVADVVKDLELAMVKIAEFRTRAEQAVSRAEMAEKAKAAVEEQLRQWREQRKRRRAALAALREESVCQANNIITFEQTPTYQPLSKVLDMKF